MAVQTIIALQARALERISQQGLVGGVPAWLYLSLGASFLCFSNLVMGCPAQCSTKPSTLLKFLAFKYTSIDRHKVHIIIDLTQSICVVKINYVSSMRSATADFPWLAVTFTSGVNGFVCPTYYLLNMHDSYRKTQGFTDSNNVGQNIYSSQQ